MRIAFPTAPDSEPRPLAAPRNDAAHLGGTLGTPLFHPSATHDVTDRGDPSSTESEQKHLNQPVC